MPTARTADTVALSINEVAALLCITRKSVAHRCARRGVVPRPHPTDRRAKLLTLADIAAISKPGRRGRPRKAATPATEVAVM